MYLLLHFENVPEIITRDLFVALYSSNRSLPLSGRMKECEYRTELLRNYKYEVITSEALQVTTFWRCAAGNEARKMVQNSKFQHWILGCIPTQLASTPGS